LVSACGLYQAVLFARGRNRWLLGLVCTGMVAGSAVVCGQRYFVDYPGYAAVRWSYGIREVIALRGGRVPPASLHQQSHLFIPYIRLVLFSLSS